MSLISSWKLPCREYMTGRSANRLVSSDDEIFPLGSKIVTLPFARLGLSELFPIRLALIKIWLVTIIT